MENNEETKRRILISEISNLRKMFPEYAFELDRCIYDVLQKRFCCDNKSCSCKMTFEQFHKKTDEIYKSMFN